MSIKLQKNIAVFLMMLALGCVAGAILATNQRAAIQGPSALVVLPDQSVWLSVEDALWHLDASGKRLAIVDASTLGVGGLIGNLVLHPNGQMVAQTRNDATLYFLDTQTAQIKSRLLPQWQADLLEHASSAINYAFNGDGRVAIATGGGHAVAVFDQTGRFIARTKPGTYEFTNGLWWSADRLWTTDTNKQQLVELDGNTLSEKSRVKLSLNCGGMQFLGMAAPSHGKISEKSKTQPLTTLVRFANGMTKGRASDIFHDGSQLDYPVSNTTEPRDLKWRGNELLLVDGASYTIKRYSDNRTPMADFGDAQVQAELTQSLHQRNTLQIRYYAYLAGAIVLFLLGFAFALLAQSKEKASALAVLNVDLSQIGTPIFSATARARMSIKLFWPLFLVLALVTPIILFLKPLLRLSGETPHMALAILIVLQLLLLIAALLAHRIVKRNANNPALEALVNQRAIQFLKTDATFWRLRHHDELPFETLLLMNARKGADWLIFTNQRLLVFTASLRDKTLAHEYPRENILRLRILETTEMTWMQRLQRIVSVVGVLIRVEFKDGTALTGFTASAQTARRIATLLQTKTFDFQASQTNWAQPADKIPTSPPPTNQHAIQQSIASFLIPGLGQWIQRRSGTALVFFVSWLLVLMAAIPVAWTLWETLAAVPTRMIFYTSGAYFLICAMAAWDTWRMRNRKHSLLIRS